MADAFAKYQAARWFYCVHTRIYFNIKAKDEIIQDNKAMLRD